ncbi:MAG TPA: hypothetical protein EYN08_03505 [Gammaproteobacteria bacterium]|nr:hypothetical protein [Gammaproteobacteria bacterium]
MPIDMDQDINNPSNQEIIKNENDKVVEKPQNNGFTYYVEQSDTMKQKSEMYQKNGAYDINKRTNISKSYEPEGEKAYHIDEIKKLQTPELRANVMRVENGEVEDYLKDIAKEEMNNIREDTIFLEALKYGTQSALFYRSKEINSFLEKEASLFDGTFLFQPLLLANGRVAPPVIMEGSDSYFQDGDTKYTRVNKTFKIHKQAKIINTPLTWRSYVNFNPSKPIIPDKMSLPLNEEEDKIWEKGVVEGWELGLKQANRIFNQQITELAIDYNGMVRYHLLEKAGIVNNPVTSRLNLGINKDERTINIGETIFEITRLPEFNSNSETWKALPSIDNFINVDDI